MTLYKSLTENNGAPYANFDFTPYLPKGGKPGKWLPKVEELVLCASGYHGCEDGAIVAYLNANIYEIETRGEVVTGDDKFTAQQIRFVRKFEGWNDVTARLFACDCASHILKIFEGKYPNDKCPRKCIAMARKFARGKATHEELAAAWDDAWDDAWAAARAAARAADWDDAWAAAWDAARDAARDADRAAAWAAARDAARDAAWDAAWAAARDDERKWQVKKLLKILEVSK